MKYHPHLIAKRSIAALAATALLWSAVPSPVIADSGRTSASINKQEQPPATENGYLIDGENALETFLHEAVSLNSQGERFLDNLRAWAAGRTADGGPFLGMVTFGKDRSAADLLFRGMPVSGFLTEEITGVMEYSIAGISFNPSDVYQLCSLPIEVNLSGICGVLSALHSLKKLGYVSTLDGDQDGDIDENILLRAKIATGTPSKCGTSIEEENEIYKLFSEGEVECGDPFSLTGSNGEKNCNKLLDELNQEKDCRLVLNDGFGGHAMHITGAGMGEVDGACIVDTLDTSQQGDGYGNGVPTNPDKQSWEAHWDRPPSDSRNVEYRNGPKKDYWNKYLNIGTTATVVCCK